MGGWFFLAAFAALSRAEYVDVLDVCCNRYGWEKAVVDACPSFFVLKQWVQRRSKALSDPKADYRTLKALL